MVMLHIDDNFKNIIFIKALEGIMVQIGELCEVKSSKRIYAHEYRKNGIPFYRSKEVIELSNGHAPSIELYIEEDKYRQIFQKFGVPLKGDVLLTAVGTLGVPYYVNADNPFYFKDGNLIWFTNFSTKLNSKWLYYWLLFKNKNNFFNLYCIGSTQAALTIDQVKKINIVLPPIYNQQHIVDTIGSVDDLIEKNKKIIEALKSYSSSIYNLFKLNSDFNQDVFYLKNDCVIRTGKLDANEADANGEYPFFTCSSDYLMINKYAYEGKSIIVAGNGVINVRYFNGKFNAYQRVYVLQPKRNLFLYLKEIEDNINILLMGANGSVIKFITKGMLEKISIPCNEMSSKVNDEIGIIYEYISQKESENIVLGKIKNNLLQKYFN